MVGFLIHPDITTEYNIYILHTEYTWTSNSSRFTSTFDEHLKSASETHRRLKKHPRAAWSDARGTHSNMNLPQAVKKRRASGSLITEWSLYASKQQPEQLIYMFSMTMTWKETVDGSNHKLRGLHTLMFHTSSIPGGGFQPWTVGWLSWWLKRGDMS